MNLNVEVLNPLVALIAGILILAEGPATRLLSGVMLTFPNGSN